MARADNAMRRPLQPWLEGPSASPGTVLLGKWPPAASLVQYALFGLEQRLLQPSQRHSVQRLETAPAELPMGGVAGCLSGKRSPSYDPAWMLHFKPGKASGWSTAHSIPPESGSAVPGPQRARLGGSHLDGAAGQIAATLLAAIGISRPAVSKAPGARCWPLWRLEKT